MKIVDIINGNSPSLSFEVFPPKTSDKFECVSNAVKEICTLSPSYMSVTYGAGGGTSLYTAQIANDVSSCGVTSLAHLSCISSNKEQVSEQLKLFSALGIKNILALRGDIPKVIDISSQSYHYAYELIDQIKASGNFCIGGACYPEGHPESESIAKDMEYLKIKIAHGCEFLTTQMFFDNGIFYSFIENLNKIGVYVPVVAGIMPLTSYNQLERIVAISGNKLPDSIIAIMEKFKHDPVSLKKAGIEFALNQAADIYKNGFNAVHIYTMNKYDVAKEIKYGLKDIIE